MVVSVAELSVVSVSGSLALTVAAFEMVPTAEGLRTRAIVAVAPPEPPDAVLWPSTFRPNAYSERRNLVLIWELPQLTRRSLPVSRNFPGTASMPQSWRLDRTLVRAYRYRGPDHEIVELYAGLPTFNARGRVPPIARISIRRHWFVNGQPAGSQAYERVSGVEERAETDPPELTSSPHCC